MRALHETDLFLVDHIALVFVGNNLFDKFFLSLYQSSFLNYTVFNSIHPDVGVSLPLYEILANCCHVILESFHLGTDINEPI